MSQEQWTAVDDYFNNFLIPADPALDAALEAQNAAGMPAINVAPNQGQFLHILALMQRAKRILEIGTLGGYSTIWLARALPEGGSLITLEYEPKHAEVAKSNIERAGLSSKVEVRTGRAIDLLPQIAEEGGDPFDLVFIDADKESSLEYFEWSLKLARAGSLIIVDNVVRNGAVLDPNHSDSRVQGVRRFLAAVAQEKRVVSTALQLVGGKGWDGLALFYVV